MCGAATAPTPACLLLQALTRATWQAGLQLTTTTASKPGNAQLGIGDMCVASVMKGMDRSSLSAAESVITGGF
jgi:hypothetical protein